MDKPKYKSVIKAVNAIPAGLKRETRNSYCNDNYKRLSEPVIVFHHTIDNPLPTSVKVCDANYNN